MTIEHLHLQYKGFSNCLVRLLEGKPNFGWIYNIESMKWNSPTTIGYYENKWQHVWIIGQLVHIQLVIVNIIYISMILEG